MTIIRKYWWKTLACLLLLVAAQILTSSARMSLHDPAFISGFTLLGCVVFLCLFNLRKKLPMLPLGRVATWTHLHILMGWFVVGLFLIHIGFRLPDGDLEVLLAILFVLVAVSGVVGTSISKSYPQRLTRRGHEVILERIPQLRAKLQDEADNLALSSVETTGNRTIADFYTSRIQPFMVRPRNQVAYLFGAAQSPHRLKEEIDAVCRYLNDDGQKIIEEIAEIVDQKDALDFHRSLQRALRLWLFVHIPLTYGMLLVALVHMVLALAYTGGF